MSFQNLMQALCALYISCTYLAFALPAQDVVRPAHRRLEVLPRLVIYFQTTHDNGTGEPLSMLPLIMEEAIALTHLIVCSFHVTFGNGPLHLNDHLPDDPRFYTLWNETLIMKKSGVKVMGMIGGKLTGSFHKLTLDSPDQATFEFHYRRVASVIKKYGLQGIDLDIEEEMSQQGITRLVRRLYADFGDDFIITLAPMAAALVNGGLNPSGFDYKTLIEDTKTRPGGGNMIDFMNTQFYGAGGSLDNASHFEQVISNGWHPDMIVGGQLTMNIGDPPFAALNRTIAKLVEEYGPIGGIMGWEYTDSAPGGKSKPWQWAQEITKIIRPDKQGQLFPISNSSLRAAVRDFL